MKMSDVFNLPVMQDGRKCMREADGDFLFSTNKLEGVAAAIAINNHDTLIEFIERLANMKPTDNLDIKAMAVKVLEECK